MLKFYTSVKQGFFGGYLMTFFSSPPIFYKKKCAYLIIFFSIIYINLIFNFNKPRVGMENQFFPFKGRSIA
jgi:hypothetical protein